MKIIRMMVLPLLLAAHGLAWGGFDEGLAAYDKGDYEAAHREFLPLAEQGDAVAQYNLGIMYQNGRGVIQDHKEAVKWYRKAADQGNVGAQYNLGVMHAIGEGVPQDYKEADKWYRTAAEQGDSNAQNSLGIMYAKGEGVPQDYIQAHMWLNIAGANGDENGIFNRDIVAKQMTPAQIAEAQRLAMEWMEEHQ
jgi:TPR repeat protein